MYKNFIAITNRKLCATHKQYLDQIDRIASCNVHSIVLREKDLDESSYTHLATEVNEICQHYQIPLTIHQYPNVASVLHLTRIHLPFSVFTQSVSQRRNSSTTIAKNDIDLFNSPDSIIGTSIHSVEDAIQAYQLGASYLFAGNIFETDCKKGLPGRGLSFLKNVCDSVPIPVYAIGGITPDQMPQLMQTGAKGACMMSGFMHI